MAPPSTHAPRLALALSCAGALAPAAASAQDRFVDRFALRLDVGAGVMVSPFQRNADPEDPQYEGNVKAFRTVAFEGSLRLAFRLFEPLSLQVSATNWVFPSATEGGRTGWVFAPSGGLRLEPRVGSAGRFFLDANAGPGFTGRLLRLAFDAAVGFEFDLTRSVALGPVVRYGQVVQPDELPDGTPERFPWDARYVSAGVSLTLRPPAGAAPRRVEAPPPLPPGVNDADGDGVPDPDDLCAGVPMGEHPDRSRHGCPETDADQDGVLDSADLCPSTAAGATPDPDRAGCPDPDNDRDGVPDHQDQCPTARTGTHPDPARRGCPSTDVDQDGMPDAADRCPDRPETFNNFEDDDGCPDRPPLVVLGDGVIRILGAINFATSSDRIIGRRSYDILDSLVALMAAHNEVARVEVQGHTDNRGAAELNLQLSQRRAEAVRLYLVEHGIAEQRVSARGYGSQHPLGSNSSSTGRAQNRRVELHILEYADGTVAAPATPAPSPAAGP